MSKWSWARQWTSDCSGWHGRHLACVWVWMRGFVKHFVLSRKKISCKFNPFTILCISSYCKRRLIIKSQVPSSAHVSLPAKTVVWFSSGVVHLNGNWETQGMSCSSITGNFQVNSLVAYWKVTDTQCAMFDVALMQDSASLLSVGKQWITQVLSAIWHWLKRGQNIFVSVIISYQRDI